MVSNFYPFYFFHSLIPYGYYSKNNDTTTEIIIAKNRAGSLGTAVLDFRGATSKFTNEDFKPF